MSRLWLSYVSSCGFGEILRSTEYVFVLGVELLGYLKLMKEGTMRKHWILLIVSAMPLLIAHAMAQSEFTTELVRAVGLP